MHPRRSVRRGSVLALAALFGASAAAHGQEPGGAPPPLSFLVVMADDLGAAELGCYGDGRGLTPNLDRLAARGMRFETCYATPLCTPTRFEILTGRYGFRNGYLNFLGAPYTARKRSPLHRIGNQTTFADVLGAAGYRCAVAGKWQLPDNGPELVRDTGFDEYCIWKWLHDLDPVDGAPTRVGTEDLPSRYWGPVLLQNGAPRPTEDTDYGPDLFTEFLLGFVRRHRREPFLAYYPMTLTHQPWERTPDPTRPIGRSRPGFPANLRYLDDLVGRLVKGLERLGLRERTVILFTGDNGSTSTGKGTLTERGVRVPLIVSCPGLIPEGTVSRALTDLSDVLPTLADLAGAPLPAEHVLDGVSLAPVLRGERETHRDWVFSYLADGRLLRTDRWLLEGGGRLFDCGTSRDGTGYVDVTSSEEPEVAAARARLDEILEGLPIPTDEETFGIRDTDAAPAHDD